MGCRARNWPRVIRSNRANAVIVTLTLLGLASFVTFGATRALESGHLEWRESIARFSGFDVMHATALMFVAYAGYGRIATLGEEVRDPARSIPRAIVVTLVLTMLVYLAVTTVAVGVELGRLVELEGAPLVEAARSLEPPALVGVIAFAAATAMAGVILNLLLGLSRVLLAMARRDDMPSALAVVDANHESPRRAVLVIGLGIAGLVAIGSVETTWSFSAFTVLIYYALTNLAALRLPPERRSR